MAAERQAGADNTLAAAVAIAPDAANSSASCLRTTGTLLDRFEQFIEESTRARDRPRRSARARRPRRLWAPRRSDRSSWPKTGWGTRCRRPSGWRGCARHGALAASAFGAGFGGSVWALVDAQDARGLSRSMAECVSRRVCSGGGAAARILFAEAAGPAKRLRLDAAKPRATRRSAERQLRDRSKRQADDSDA